MLSGKPQTLTSKFKISYTICLNNIASNENNVIDFVNRSMIINDIETEIKNYDKTITDIETVIENKELTYNNIRTNKEIMSEYINHKNKISNLSNKERKKTARNIRNLEDENRFIKDEYQIYQDIEAYKMEIKKYKTFKSNAESYLNTHTENTISMLRDYNFIDEHNNISDMGKIARQFQEIHPLVIATAIYETNYFEDFTPMELVGIFSCFTSIRVDDSHKKILPSTSSDRVNKISVKINSLMDKFIDLEQKYNIYSGSNYERNFDIQEYTMKWCEAEGDYACKEILITIQNETGNVFLGDFIKAILKINNISNEVERAAESLNQISLIEKLRKIPELTLKYVATTQSLYI
tara:strand:- start:80 stop:1135 length:1056 start_codon:yes stop_codon:yes gene_type:complete